MTEGGIADRELAALALKQASGDNVEAIFCSAPTALRWQKWRSVNRLTVQKCALSAEFPQSTKIFPAGSCWVQPMTTPIACWILLCWLMAKRRPCAAQTARRMPPARLFLLANQAGKA